MGCKVGWVKFQDDIINTQSDPKLSYYGMKFIWQQDAVFTGHKVPEIYKSVRCNWVII